MVSRLRLFQNDEELGKKDDDHKYTKKGKRPWQWTAFKRKRIALFAVMLILAYVFIKNIPTDLGPAKNRFRYGFSTPRPSDEDMLRMSRGIDRSTPAQGAPPRRTAPEALTEPVANIAHDFDGPVRFYYLAASLHSISRTQGHRSSNKNVLFAASDLKSASIIIPVACEMARWKRNHVHFAFMGRDEITMEALKQVNGVDEHSCDIFWHDARPDFSPYSTDGRMETSVYGALGHIDTFMHPQAIVTAGMSSENMYFMRSIRSKAKIFKAPVIEIPKEKPESLYWLARLDANALNAWHTASIDIVVQAPLQSSGSLIRLLNSLASADYTGFTPPRLTIELPHRIDVGTQAFLADFTWPPEQSLSQRQNNELILRRRIPEDMIRPSDASTRFIESFYPASFDGPHVLVLSPQAELSPVYFHYLKFYLLEYRYSNAASRDSEELFGISLETPSTHLNGTVGFVPPASGTVSLKSDEDAPFEPFLWQAPNSNAALYFSDKWMEIHSFLTKRHTATRHPATRDWHNSRGKALSEVFPSWTESFLDLMRARGYSMLYPGRFASDPLLASPDLAQSLAIIHNELYQPPEEYLQTPRRGDRVQDVPLPTASILTANNDYLNAHQHTPVHPNNLERPLFRNLYSVIPPASQASTQNIVDEGELPTTLMQDAQKSKIVPIVALVSLPLLDHYGIKIARSALRERSDHLSAAWRERAGGCQGQKLPRKQDIIAGSAEDLFCFHMLDKEFATEEDDVTVAEPPRQPAEAPAKSEPPLPPLPSRTVPPGSGGVAHSVDAVANAAHYLETARAGFKAKTGGDSYVAPRPKAGGDKRVDEDDRNLEIQRKPDSAGDDPKHRLADNPAQHDISLPTRSTHVPGSGGAAGGIGRVVDAERYAATARAGLVSKLNSPAVADTSPSSGERAEPDDWLVKNTQNAPTSSDTGDTPAPRSGPASEDVGRRDEDPDEPAVRKFPRLRVTEDPLVDGMESGRMSDEEVPRVGGREQRESDARRRAGPLKMKVPIVYDGDEDEGLAADGLGSGAARPRRGAVDEFAAAFRGTKIVSEGEEVLSAEMASGARDGAREDKR